MTAATPLVCPYSDDLAAALTDRQPGAVVIDFSEALLEEDAIAALSQQHRAWRAAGWSVAYTAPRSSTRGALVVALYRAEDFDTVVTTSVAQATRALAAGQRRLADALGRLGLDGVEPAARPSTWQTRSVATGFTWLGSLQQGYKTPFIENMLRTYGISAMPQLSPALQGALDELTDQLGERHAQAAVAFAALGNGCPFCSYGHLYAADLLYFEETGELCPIDPAALTEARGWRDEAVSSWVAAQLVGPTWAPIAETVLRLQALRSGAAPEGAVDELLLRILAAWMLINECSLQVQTETAPPLHPRMARARRLQRSYRAARAALRVA